MKKIDWNPVQDKSKTLLVTIPSNKVKYIMFEAATPQPEEQELIDQLLCLANDPVRQQHLLLQFDNYFQENAVNRKTKKRKVPDNNHADTQQVTELWVIESQQEDFQQENHFEWSDLEFF